MGMILLSGILGTIQESVQALIYIVGGAIAMVGVMDALSGYSNQSSGKMSEGVIKAVGGAGIILIGLKLVPAIFNGIGL